MDLPLLDNLPDSPLFDKNNLDPFPEDPNDLLFADPFPEIPLPPDTDNPKSELVLDPFDAPPIPLAPVSRLPQNPVQVTATSHTDPPAPLLSERQISTVDISTTPLAPITIPMPPPREEHSSPLQENRPLNTPPPHLTTKLTSAKLKKPTPKRPAPAGKTAVSGKKVDVSPEQRNKDKLAQRKLRNKESARRYREKQVARRKQLENYTRTLTEQNRELEILHQKLLRMTCERGLGLHELPPNVL